MEEISPAVALTLSLANTMCDSGISSITELDNVTDAVNMLCDQNGEVEYTMEEDVSKEPEEKPLSQARTLSSDYALTVQESESEEDVLLSDATTITAEVLITSLNMEEVVTASEVVISLPEENHHHNVARGGSRSVYELDCIPLWGTVSIRGERSEMEDAVRALPRFLKIPIKMLMEGDQEGMSPSLTHLTSHFFGVYDGHGGLHVADYCHDRIHFALAEEIEWTKEELCERNTGEGRLQVQWEKVFFDCFLKVDDEVKGKINRPVLGSPDEMVLEAVSPETVGSTAVVALVCSSHIIVSNCGDSRAVLLRGKEAMPLSVDHKVKTPHF